MMAQPLMRWMAAVTAVLLFAGPAQALEFQLSDSVVDLRFDEYGAIGEHFVENTQLLGATELPSSNTDVDMMWAGTVYLPQFNQILGSSTLNGRSGLSTATTHGFIGPNQFRSRYVAPLNGAELGVQVDTSLASPGMVHQTYTFEYRDVAGDLTGADNEVMVPALPLLITYLLDPDIGTDEDDDNGSVAAGTARAWDVDFANPGSATPSGFNDPMIEMLSFLNGLAPDELGTSDSGSSGMLNDLDNPGPLSTADVDGPADDDDGAYGARWAQIDLGPNNPTATLDIDIQFGGLHRPHNDKPIPEPFTATLSMMALGALVWRTSRRKGHDTL